MRQPQLPQAGFFSVKRARATPSRSSQGELAAEKASQVGALPPSSKQLPHPRPSLGQKGSVPETEPLLPLPHTSSE